MKILKQTIHIAFLLLTPFSLCAQISNSKPFFYNGENKKYLETSISHILVKFVSDQNDIRIRKQAELLLNTTVQLDKIIDLIPPDRAVKFKLKKDAQSKFGMEKLITNLLSNSTIESAYPIFISNGESMMIFNTIITAFNPSATELDKSKQVLKAHQLEIVEEYLFPNNTVQLLKVPKGKHTLDLSNELYETNEYLYAHPNFISYAENTYAPNDDSLSTQWYLSNDGNNWNGTVDADADVLEAWDITTGSAKVKVAVLEGGGFDYNHPDARVSQPFDAANNDFDPAPQNSNDNHGTAVMGCVAANTGNGIGIAGTGYNSIVVPITIGIVTPSGLFFSISDISITRTANHVVNVVNEEGVFVVSNSWAGNLTTPARTAAYNNMLKNSRNGLGAVVLAAADNSDTNNGILFPALYPGVIAVGASSPCDTRKSTSSCDGENWWGSNWGDSLNIMAPGVKIQTLDRSGTAGYTFTNYEPIFGGTSAACPIAAGITALVFQWIDV